jgi:hypothetical protein
MADKEEEKQSQEIQKVEDALKVVRNFTGYGSVTITLHAGEIIETEIAFTVRPEKKNLDNKQTA